MKIVINRCYGGFGLSDAAYEKIASYGVPIVKYNPPERDPETGLFGPEEYDGQKVIFDRDLDAPSAVGTAMRELGGRYWTSWARREEERTDPLVVRAVEELGPKAASGRFAELKVVEVPDGMDWELDEYGGIETVRERSASWS